ncbi:superoxide dismutase family protein [Peribacillus alkalitolerans]|uniref:superoxide dismutase family protein n=1 Tax=Peribacillus alkalitolerans TaxID=1550385 RepID=UPI0013CFCEEB|nr:superoxide dismutase family protein [Peribacillus alkalitolerans]
MAGCTQQNQNPTKMDVEMHNEVGDSLGKIKLTEKSKGIELDINLEGLEAGEHAIHIHDKPKCEAPEFKSAGNHYDPEKKKHGLLHPEGAHAGDLPNLIVKEDGSVKVKISAPTVTLRQGKKNSLLGKEGTSIVITSKKDDGMTQPAGDSGKRIACGVISKKKK